MRAATDGRLLCRINGYGPWTAGEVDDALAAGADELFLPMVRGTEEVDRTLDLVAGRCGLGILVETQDAVDRAAALARRPLSRIYVGLNDLRIDRRSSELFRPLVDGTVDAVRARGRPALRGRRADPARGRLAGARRAAGRGAGAVGHGLHLPAPVLHRRHGRPRPVRRGPARCSRGWTGCAAADAATAAARRADFVAAVEGSRGRGCRRRSPSPLRRDGLRPVRALVTGAGGFVGRHLVRRLAVDGWDVVALTRASVDLADPGRRRGGGPGRRRPTSSSPWPPGGRRRRAAERAATVAVNTSPWLVDALPDRCRVVVRLGSSTEYAAGPGPLAEDAPAAAARVLRRDQGGRFAAAAGGRRRARGAVGGAARLPGLRTGRPPDPAGARGPRRGPRRGHRAAAGGGQPAGLGVGGRRGGRLRPGGHRRTPCRRARCSTSAPACRPAPRSWSPRPSGPPAARSRPRPGRTRAGPGTPPTGCATRARRPSCSAGGRRSALEEGLRPHLGGRSRVTGGTGPRVAVVVPVYGNADTLEPLAARAGRGAGRPGLAAAVGRRRLARRQRADRAPAWPAAIARIAATLLTENVGQHRALYAGLAAEPGADAWICLDADLQDPPEARAGAARPAGRRRRRGRLRRPARQLHLARCAG